MTDLKFECPACGQHMECDRACSGDVIHCPKCCAELRIPFRPPKPLPGSIERAELLHVATSPPNTHATSANGAAQEPTAAAASPDAVQHADVTCPVCQSQLRVRPAAIRKSGGSPPIAELLHKAATGTGSAADLSTHDRVGTQASSETSFEEREKQIAAAREAHPIQLYSAQKPRLEYVLSGGAAPVKTAEPEKSKIPEHWQPEFFSE